MKPETIYERFREAFDREFVRPLLDKVFAQLGPRRVPIDEVCTDMRERLHCGEGVIARVRRLNPDGVYEGERVRGWHPKENPTLLLGVLSRDDVERKFGQGSWERFPPEAFLRQGRRRYLKRTAFMDGPPDGQAPG